MTALNYLEFRWFLQNFIRRVLSKCGQNRKETSFRDDDVQSPRKAAKLPHGFVNDRIRRAGQIEAPDELCHWQLEIPAQLLFPNPIRKPSRLAAE
jgi:hypothetical protein